MIHIIIERSAATMQLVYISTSFDTYESVRDFARSLESENKVFDVDVLSFENLQKLNHHLLERVQPQVVSLRFGPKAPQILTTEMKERAESQAESHIEAYKDMYYALPSSNLYNLIYNVHDDSLERESLGEEFADYFCSLAGNDELFDREEYEEAAIKYFNDTVFYTLTR